MSTRTAKTGEIYRIDYKDRHGEITNRIITINRIYRDNYTTYIDAYCHLCNEERTFRLERIIGTITNTTTGEIIDPDELSPLKRKTIIPVEKHRSGLHLEMTGKNEGCLLHHPNDNVSVKAEREKLRLITYRYQIDAYRTAINKTIESGADTLFLYVYGKYRPSTVPDNANQITIIQIDLRTPEGRIKKKHLECYKVVKGLV